jgi:hypothetical protein
VIRVWVWLVLKAMQVGFMAGKVYSRWEVLDV